MQRENQSYSCTGTYHRGTRNRPVHPAMRSQIPFGSGAGAGWMHDPVPIATAQNSRPNNPASIAGRSSASHVSVGLQNQQSPREMREKMQKQMEQKEYLLFQMEEKRIKKEEERMMLEREVMEEELTLQWEREKLAREFEIEQGMHQKKSKVEEQRRLRVQIADEKSAIAAKQQMKKSSKRLVHQQSGKRASITDETMDSGYYGRDAVARQEEKLEWLDAPMKAQSQYNPTSVAGRCNAAHVSVGLQDQQSPREMREKIQKQMEHKEYLLFQMEEKRMKKEEERMILENEAMEEELRLQGEREKLAREFEMEKQMQKRKKAEEQKKIEILQNRIKMAKQSAIAAKEETKMSKRLLHRQSGKHGVCITDERMDSGYDLAREEETMEWQDTCTPTMKAQSQYNPSSVAGRSNAAHVSVGLQDQWSPREMNEKIQKQMEHKEYLLFQMEEKRMKKEEERMRIENEAMEEELRLQGEREKLAREFEMEKQMQNRKKIEEQKKIELLQSRIKMAKESAIAAKEEMKKSKRLAHQQSGKRAIHHKHNTDYDGSPDPNSPSLPSHSIRMRSIQSQQTVSGSNNSQVSSSSEEPAVPMKRKTRYKHEEPSDFKTSGPPVIEGSRIPRRIVSRKQIAKPTQSENESDVNFNGRRKITSTQSQQPTCNSIAKPKAKSATYRVGHRTYRPASNESLDELVHYPRRPPINAHSVPESEEDIPPVTKAISPPVPAVANRLVRRVPKNKKNNDTLPEKDTLPPLRLEAPSPPVPAMANRLARHVSTNKKESNTLPEKDTLPPLRLEAPSPPVPAMANRLARRVSTNKKENNTLPEKDTLPPLRVEAPSPPVPAMANRLACRVSTNKKENNTLPEKDTLPPLRVEAPSPPVPAVAHKLAHHVPKSREEPERNTLPPIPSSPPVPAVANRVHVTRHVSTNKKESNTLPEKDTLPPLRLEAPSPPVPAAAHRLGCHVPKSQKENNTWPERNTLPPISSSPPVPAVAHRLGRHDPKSQGDFNTLPERNTLPPISSSPPVPAVAHRLADNIPPNKECKNTCMSLKRDTLSPISDAQSPENEENIIPPLKELTQDDKYMYTGHSQAVRPLPLPTSGVKCHHYFTIDRPLPCPISEIPARYCSLTMNGKRFAEEKLSSRDQICIMPTIEEESRSTTKVTCTCRCHQKTGEDSKLIEQLHRLKKQMREFLVLPKKFNK